MSFHFQDFISDFNATFPNGQQQQPWEVTQHLSDILTEVIQELGADFTISDGIAIHKTATVEPGVVLKGPIIIGENTFIGANAYLRGGVYLGNNCTIGPGCEVKSSILMNHSGLAHFNFVGDSIIGSHVNLEAGAVIANHYNERIDKQISVLLEGQRVKTGTEKFGALIGDHCKIGANAVLSPGTLLYPDTIIKRLELVEQIK